MIKMSDSMMCYAPVDNRKISDFLDIVGKTKAQEILNDPEQFFKLFYKPALIDFRDELDNNVYVLNGRTLEKTVDCRSYIKTQFVFDLNHPENEFDHVIEYIKFFADQVLIYDLIDENKLGK